MNAPSSRITRYASSIVFSNTAPNPPPCGSSVSSSPPLPRAACTTRPSPRHSVGCVILLVASFCWLVWLLCAAFDTRSQTKLSVSASFTASNASITTTLPYAGSRRLLPSPPPSPSSRSAVERSIVSLAPMKQHLINACTTRAARHSPPSLTTATHRKRRVAHTCSHHSMSDGSAPRAQTLGRRQ